MKRALKTPVRYFMPEITHICPPEGSGRTPCCDKSPFELPRTDRMTFNAALVTCPTKNGASGE